MTAQISIKTIVLGVVAVALLSGGVAAAVTISALDTNPLVAGDGTLGEASDLNIDSHELTFNGNNVTDIDVSVKNTAGSDATVDLHVAFKTSAGSTVTAQSQSGKTATANSVTTFTVSLSTTPGVDQFSEVEVTVEKTA